MRKLAIAACVTIAGCTGRGGSVDSSAAPDSSVVAGPPAVPSTLTPPPDSAATRAPVPATTPRGAAPAPPSTPGSSVDSVRGTVSVVGTSFEKRVMVAVAGTTRRVEITGRLASLIGNVAGAEVGVTGTMTGARLEADRFVVRAVDGQPAIDGVLRTEGGAMYIVTTEGARTRIAAPPPPLQGRDGARVWVTGDPARGISSFGFIDPPR